MNLTWMDAANCAGLPLDFFFPTQGQPLDEARTVCARCDVRMNCLEWAMTMPATDLHYGGVLAGLAPRELSDMRARRREEAAA